MDRAVQANSAGRPARARVLLHRVLRAVGPDVAAVDRPELMTVRGRAKITLALAEFDSGRRDAAFALLDDAEDDARAGAAHDAGGSDTVRTLAAVQRSGLYGRLGEWRLALDAMTAIGDAAAQVGPRAAAVVALNSGLARQFLGDLAGSASDLQRAERIAAEHRIADVAAAATHNRGRLEYLRGNISRALELMGGASRMSEAVARSGADLDRARVLLDAGLLDAADALLAECAAVARAERLVHDVGEIALERARLALLLGEYERALARATESARVFGRHREHAWRTQAALLRLEAGLALGRPAGQVARQAVELADGPAAASGIDAPAALLAVEALARAGDVGGARSRLGSIRDRRLPFPDRLHRYLATAVVATAAGDPAAARRTLRAAVGALATEQGRYAALDTRTAVALHGRRLLAMDVGFGLAAGSPRAVFEACERWRGVSYRLPRVSPTDDPELDRLLVELRQARADLRGAEGADGRARLLTRVAQLERAVQRRDWETSGSGRADRRGTARPISYAALRGALTAAGAGMVAPFVHDGRLRAVTIGPAGGRIHDLAPVAELVEQAQRIAADLTALTRAVDPELSRVVRRALTRTLTAVGDVLAPALPDTPRVVVLPPRQLASLPWRMLPPLADRILTLAPSATFWGRHETRRDPSRAGSSTDRAAPRVVAVAGPGLERAAAEVDGIVRQWPDALTVTGPAATGSALVGALRDASVVHVAAHGSHHEQSPLFSSVLLSDGPLFAHEFQRVGVGAEHVVLSACDVGRARVRPGEETLGLTSALLACGVRTVVAAVAPVSDELAEVIMTRYHRELAAGRDAAAALQRAGAELPDARLFCTYGADWQAPADGP